MNRYHRRPIALAARSGALALAPCGSSTESTARTTGPSQYAPGVTYSDCTQAHGVPSFPDPSPCGGFALRTSGIDVQAPTAALRTCARLNPEGNRLPATIPATQQAGMLENARRTRAHGVASFPDPRFGLGDEGAGVNFPQADLNSPAFHPSAKACTHAGDPIPGVGVG